MHPILTVPLPYRLRLASAGSHAVIRATTTGWEIIQDHHVRPGDTVWTIDDLLAAGDGALTRGLVA